MDFAVPDAAARLLLIEAKATRTPRPEDAEAIHRLGRALGGRAVRGLLVHRGTGAERALRPGTEAVSLPMLRVIPSRGGAGSR